MAIGDKITVSVEKIAPGGDGLALLEGKRIFIPLSAQGDLVKAKITEEHDSWARAEIREICEPSPDRINPPCPKYGECGGCSFQHLSYQAQLEAKKGILEETLAHFGETLAHTSVSGKKTPKSAEIPPITVIPSEPWGYRNRVSLHAIRSNHFPRCGFKARSKDEVIPLSDCPVAASGVRQVLPCLLPPPGKDRFTLYSKDQTLIAENGTFVADDKITPQIQRKIPSRGTIKLLGLEPDEDSMTPLSREITLGASSFFQSNAGALESLIRQLRRTAEKAISAHIKTERMADLYSGVGTLSLFLTDLFPSGIDLLESDSTALNLAKSNLGYVKPANNKYFTQKPGKYLFYHQKAEQWARRRNMGSYDFIVADPPRQGLPHNLIQSLCDSGAPVFVYVSCGASSFARDFHILSESYKPESIFLFDFYPQTAHIETMCTFIRK